MVMDVRIRDGGDLRKLTRDLYKHGDPKVIRKQLVTGIRDELKPLRQAVQAAYRSGPSSGRGRGVLRRALARAVTLTIRTSGRDARVSIGVPGKKMPDGMGRIPKMYEGMTPWRHPLFGNRDVWVSQDPHPTFYRLVVPYQRVIRRRIERIAENLARKIGAG